MNRTNFIRYFFIGLVLVTFIAGCAATQHKESTGEYVDDSVLTSKVKAEIFNDPMLKVLQINVESFKGVVQLSGFVDSAQASARAVEVAKSVKGVQSVKNSLAVK
jgi:osmotically-inducible protein OsmY